MTTPVSSFSGVVSGIQYRDLVDQIITAEGAAASRKRNQASQLKSRLEVIKTYRTLLDGFKSAARALREGGAFETTVTTVSGATTAAGRTVLGASSSAKAQPGSYAVEVLGVAAAEKLSGAAFATSTAGLGVSGDFFVNGVKVSVAATDALADIRTKINEANTGAAPSRVGAALLSDGGRSRLVLTSTQTGRAGIDLVDGPGGVLRQLGLLDAAVSPKHPTSAGAESDRFASDTAAVGALRGLTGLGPQTVGIGGQSVSLDLSTDSLSTIATKLSALAGVSATVKTETVDGAATSWLDVRAPAGMTDAGHTLELLGLVKGGRSAVAQSVAGAALTAGDGATPAAADTLLGDLWSGVPAAAGSAQAGDTFTIAGTRGDGSSVGFTYTIQPGDTVQTLLDRLNSTTDGFGAGARPAVATIDAEGRIRVTDGTSGDSRLALSITAANQGGGRLDFGAMTVDEAGRSRTLVAGSDATIRVDGVTMTRATNTITDAIADVTLDVQGFEPGLVATVQVERSASGASAAAKTFVESYNKLVDLIKAQGTAAPEGQANPPLYNDPLMRLGRSALPAQLLQAVTGAAAGLATASSAGISLTKDGKLALDAGKFEKAYNERFEDLRRLFMERGVTGSSSFTYVSASGKAAGGSYAVEVAAAASRALAGGAGFGGVYAGAAPGGDTITVSDAQGGGSASVTLADGMTAEQIAAALNAAFAAPVRQQVRTADALFADAAGTTPATGATTFAELRLAGGIAAGVRAGDTIAIGGTRADGTAITATFTVGDPAVTTLDDLRAAIQAQYVDAAVTLRDGRFVVEAANAGTSSLALSLTAGREGGGGLTFGGSVTDTVGRGALAVTASVANGQLQLQHGAYGAASGFTVAFAGAATAQLGLGAATYRGTDVAGTIGGAAATASGMQLSGAAGTAAEGLIVQYAGSGPASTQLGLTVGVGAMMERLLDAWLSGDGMVGGKEAALQRNVEQLSAQADRMDARLELRRERLLKQFAQMETAMSRLKQQTSAVIALNNTTSQS